MVFDFLLGKTVGEPVPELKPSVRALLDELIGYASEKRFGQRLEEAREYYYLKAGKINEDDADFVQRMNTVLEWFIFDHRPGGIGTNSLFDQYMGEKRARLSSAELVERMAMSKHLHSMFMVISCGDGTIKVKDMATKRRYVVSNDDRLEKGDILEARIVFLGSGCFFTYTHCLHPKAALKPIMGELKKWKSKMLGEDFFFKLQNMQLKWRRFRQISINDIYRM